MSTFRMPRGWMDHPALNAMNEPFDRRSAWAWLWETANYAPGEKPVNGVRVPLERGQLAASIRYLSIAWKWDACKVRRFLNRLQTDTLVKLDTIHGLTRITICNYGEIQDFRHTNRHTKETVADIGLRHNRHKTKEESYKNLYAGDSCDSPEGVQGEVSAGRSAGGWSPKINDPLQLDLIGDTALAADYREEAESRDAAQLLQAEALEPGGPELGEPEASGAAELEAGSIAPPPPTLSAPTLRIVEERAPPPPPPPPLELSLEGEVLPAELEPEPELELEMGAPIAPPPIAPPPRPGGRNVVPFLRKPPAANDPDFLEWYAQYPRHKSKLRAATAYAEARKRATREELLEGAMRYSAERTGKDPTYTAYPATWLNGGAWEDKPDEVGERNGDEQRRQGYSDQRPARGADATANLYRRLFGQGD